MNIDWHIKGKQFGNCNCNYGCPCQFNAPPTDNYCHGIGAFLIEEGFLANLDGKVALTTKGLDEKNRLCTLAGLNIKYSFERQNHQKTK